MRGPGNEQKASIDYRKRSLFRPVEEGARRRLSTPCARRRTMASACDREAYLLEKSMSDRSFTRPRRRLIVATAAAVLLPRFAAANAIAEGPADRGSGLRDPLLASLYTGQVDPGLCLVSEKYDGVRAVWDGRVLRYRSGREVAAPRPFLAALPLEPLDGELWLGRGRFDALSAIVRTSPPQPADWLRIRYMAFELPAGAGTFAERAKRLAELAQASANAQLVAAPQERIEGRAALMRRLQSVVAAGGEGLMLHLAGAPVAAGRSGTLMKLKPHLDAEAVVVGTRPGAGKY